MNYLRRTAAVAFLLLTGLLAKAQEIPPAYFDYVRKADSLYRIKEYRKSGETYSLAFQANSWKGFSNDRYNAACSWALAGNADSAFFQLERLAVGVNYANYGHITTDTDLTTLYADKRWTLLVATVKANKEKLEINYIHPLVEQLDTIYSEDQHYRGQISQLAEKYGWKSPQLDSLWKIIGVKDSINLEKVTKILDEYGWLGPDKVSGPGNTTLFLVIQHADQATQEKYLPMMRDAVTKGNAAGSQLVLLEDRVALGQGKKQIYGSQIGQNPANNEFYVQPLEDPDNVDQRRESVGLPPLSAYVTNWNLTWDVEQYKMDLPAIEAMEKARNVK